MSFTKFQIDCLNSHNGFRKKHGVPALVLSEELCSFSQEWANYLAYTLQNMEHRTDSDYGENIYSMWSSDHSHQVNGKDAVESWYSEIQYYTFRREPNSLQAGHFTQVIWKESEELGVGVAQNEGNTYVVANYNPPGNYVGCYTENVPPIGGF